MPSIPDTFIDDLRARVDLSDLIGRYVTLKKAGNRYMGVCPFHGDSNPSMSVNPERGFWYCFGCQAGGDAIAFVRQKENLEFVEAIQFLARLYGMVVPEVQSDPNAPKRKTLYEINEFAQNLYVRFLKSKSGRTFREYLIGRGFTKDTILDYKLGAAPESWDFISKQLQSSGFPENDILETGLVMISQKDSSRKYDRFRNRLMIPIIDTVSRTVGFGGRDMGDEGPKYMNSPESKIFHKSNLLFGMNLAKNSASETNQLIVMEGYTDVMMSYQGEMKNCCAVMGTALTEEHIPLLQRFANEVILVFDGDDAGKRATLRSLNALANVDFVVKVYTLPKGKDPADIVVKHGGEKFKKVLTKSVSGPDWVFSHFADPVKDSDLRTRLLAFQNVAPYILAHKNKLLQDELIERAALAFSIPESGIRDGLRNVRENKSTVGKTSDSGTLEAIFNGIEMAERTFFLSLFENPNYIGDVRDLLTRDDFENPLHKKLAGIILQPGFILNSPDNLTKKDEVINDMNLFSYVVRLIDDIDKLRESESDRGLSEKDLRISIHRIITRQYDSQKKELQEKLHQAQNQLKDKPEVKDALLGLVTEVQDLEDRYRTASANLIGEAVDRNNVVMGDG
jgi:DNA primase